MRRLRKLLVVADPITTQPALHRAIAIAKAARAELMLVAFVHDPLGDDDSLLSERERLALREQLIAARKLLLMAELASVPARFRRNVAVIWHKRYHEWLCANVRKLGVDLVVKRARPSRKAFYMPSDWHLMRNLPLPLWLVDGRSPESGPVIAAVDAGDNRVAQGKLDAGVLSAAAFIAKRWKFLFKAVYVRALPRLLFDLDLVDHRAYKLKAEKQAREALARRCEQAGVQQQVTETLVAFGKPQQSIPRLVRREKASLLVMGTSARSGVEGFMVGNTSERVVSEVSCDVLIINRWAR